MKLGLEYSPFSFFLFVWVNHFVVAFNVKRINEKAFFFYFIFSSNETHLNSDHWLLEVDAWQSICNACLISIIIHPVNVAKIYYVD